MCGRSSLTKNEKEIEARFNASFYSDELERYNPLPNYNVAPTHMMPVITNQEPDKINIFKWGLVPFWAKNSKIGFKMINARIETIADKPAFRNALKQRRCLVPMDGFYEWKKNGKTKTPYRIVLPQTPIFSVAGLWETWGDIHGNKIHSYTIITQPANEIMSDIHDRMPAILSPDQEKLWIDNDLSPSEALKTIYSYPSELMKSYKVDQRVGKVSENDAKLLIPVKDDIDNLGVQGELF
ncbi:MAG: SOS response-associated peptidase [Saprospiraceae bacterium]